MGLRAVEYSHKLLVLRNGTNGARGTWFAVQLPRFMSRFFWGWRVQGEAVMALGPCPVAFLAMAGVNTVQNFRGRINSTVTDNTLPFCPA